MFGLSKSCILTISSWPMVLLFILLVMASWAVGTVLNERKTVCLPTDIKPMPPVDSSNGKPSRRFQMGQGKVEYCPLKTADGPNVEFAYGAFLQDIDSADKSGKNCMFIRAGQKENKRKTTLATTTTTPTTTRKTPELWVLDKTIGTGDGLIVDGKVKDDWKKIEFSLLTPDKEKLLHFVAEKVNDEKAELKFTPLNGKLTNMSVDVSSIIKGGQFELYIELDDKAVKLYGNLPLQLKGNQKVEVASVEVDADFDGQMEKHVTIKIPSEGSVFALNGTATENGDKIQITGKFFAKATKLSISLMNFEDDSKSVETCLKTDTDNACLINFNIHITLADSKILLRRQQPIWQDNLQKTKKEWYEPKEQTTMLFVPGMDFSVTINIVADPLDNTKQIFTVDKVEGMQYTRVKSETNKILVELDDGVIFGQPIVLKK